MFYLYSAGYEPILPDEAEQKAFMALIYRIKAGETDPDIIEGMEKLAASLAFAGAEILIAGCTEIPLFLNSQNSPLTVLASTDLLVSRTIALSRQQLPLE